MIKRLLLIIFIMWTCKICYSDIDVTRTLNSISNESAQTAKIVSIGNNFIIFYET